MAFKELLDQAKEGFIAKAPEEVQSQVLRHIKEQQESGIVFGLEEGDKAPNFMLANPLGEQVNLYDELAKGPVVLTFYRGSWCPFCNIQLRAYQQLLPDIEKLEDCHESVFIRICVYLSNFCVILKYLFFWGSNRMTKSHKLLSKTSHVHLLCKPLQLELQEVQRDEPTRENILVIEGG